jgi:c-di-AMP phosphodiesterase-like protein
LLNKKDNFIFFFIKARQYYSIIKKEDVVKMQIDADKVKELIEKASQVVIMAHHNLDLDALGSSLGVYYICRALGKNTSLLIEEGVHETGVARSLNELHRQKINIKIQKWKDLEKKIDKKTLLIVLDTHINNLLQSKEALNISSIIIIDHHINEGYNIPTVYEYISEEQSSAVEIIIELLKHLNIYIHPYVATIMLAGIFIDTNGFFSKTNYKTHEGAAYLYQCGASLKEVQYLLKENVEKYNDRQQVISEAKIINKHFAIAVGHDNYIYHKEDLAKISDTMLLFNYVEASFTIGKIDEDTIGISARSLGSINVQAIMEQLGGGGHLADAATQLKGETLQSARLKLKNIVSKLEGGF